MGLKVPKLDDYDFAKLIAEAINRIPVYSPEWTDYNLHDPGITFIELLAWLTDMQIYQLDKLTEKHKLKFLSLLNFQPRPSLPSRVQVTFNMSGNSPLKVKRGTKLEAKIEGNSIPFETIDDLWVTPIKIQGILTSSKNLEFSLRNINVDYIQSVDASYFYPFGEEPTKGATFYLGYDKAIPWKDDSNREVDEISLAINLFEKDLPPKGIHDEPPDIIPSASVKWQYSSVDETTNSCSWKQLEILKDSTRAFSQSGYIRFKPPLDLTTCNDDKLALSNGDPCYWLRCKLDSVDTFEIPPRIESVRMNTVDAVQMRKCEYDIREKTTDLPDQLYNLKHYPVVPRRLVVQVKENGKWEEWRLVDQLENYTKKERCCVLYYNEEKKNHQKYCLKFGDNKHGRIPKKGFENIRVFSKIFESDGEEIFFSSSGKPCQSFPLDQVPPIPKNILLTIGEPGEIWNEVPDFDASSPNQRHFTLNLQNGIIKLGTGVRGRIDPEKDVVTPEYYCHCGEEGNIRRGQISTIVDQIGSDDDLTVTNFFDAVGGTKAESIEDAISRIREDLKMRYRAVTYDDCEDIVTCANLALVIAVIDFVTPVFDTTNGSFFLELTCN